MRFSPEGSLPEGPGCQVRGSTFDHPFLYHRARQACPSEKIHKASRAAKWTEFQ
ncbi:hypothetical protein THTE_3159 [Thermogutta terrifontis]|uniref:Uncharacterized protein n=1 Tax=Thermogutta terrifontis TaxID=1331910 RepID=A0A286RIH1_9BACT|nr:hypothetical protein THTE_3159 [Thermogutta terrifontis]